MLQSNSFVWVIQTQLLAYSHSLDDLVRYLCIVPFPGSSLINDEVNESEYKRTFIHSFEEADSHSSRHRDYVMWCWIITHPTSNVFLSSNVIYQLYMYTHKNRKCFWIVVSTRNDGMKMVCVKLTPREFTEMIKIETEISQTQMSFEK